MNKENLVLAAILVAAVGFFGFNYYTSTPGYIAQQQYEKGIAQIESGEFGPGISNLIEVARGEASVKDNAREALGGLLQDSSLDTLPPGESVEVLGLLFPFYKGNPVYTTVLQSRFDSYNPGRPWLAGQLAMLAGNSISGEEDSLAYRRKAHDLLLEKVELLKANKRLAMDFTLIDEELNECRNCPVVLEAFEAELGEHEAARALGQYYSRVNKLEKAFQLLEPYTLSRLTIYHEAEKEYDKILNSIWDQSIEDLNNGLATQSFYDDYEKADEVKQNEMVNQFYLEKVNKSRKVDEALARYQASAAIVPVVLDLGIVRLGRAMSMTDSSERQAELNEAESLFLSVKSFAGESDDYQLYLGQVYYWLGKEEEGDKLFTALIEKYNRGDAVLASISSILRDLGARVKATEYIEEAYEKAETLESKQDYAYQRNLLAKNSEERIEWLEKSDKSKAYVKADLFSEKAAQAERENNKKLALKYYQKAIDSYGQLTESESLFNNIALIYMSKFYLGHDESDYDRALENMDRAIEIGGDDSIVLSNAADYYALRTYRDILEKELDLRALDFRPSLNLFSYLYNDSAEKKKYIEQIKASPNYNKMMEYIKKASLLSPKDPSVFETTYSTFYFLRLEDDIHNLVGRLNSIGLELQADKEDIEKYRSGESDADSIRDLRESIDIFNEKLDSLDGDAHPLELVVANTFAGRLRLSLMNYGEDIEIDELLKQARSSYKRYPTTATRSHYLNVLLEKLVQESAASHAGFRSFYEQYERIYDAEYIIAMAVNGMNDYRQQIQQSDIFNEYAGLVMVSDRNFPEVPDTNDWYLLKTVDPEYAAGIKKRYINSVLARDRNKIAYMLLTNQEITSLEKYIELMMLDKPEDAKNVISEARAKGLKLPGFI